MSDLTLIYHFQSSQNQNDDFQPARYRMVFFFDEEGFLDSEVLKEIAKSIPDIQENMTFLNLDDLKSFALRVAQELQFEQVRLISVQDYNIGIDGSKDEKSFRESLTKYGELVQNEGISKKKGLLGRFFS